MLLNDARARVVEALKGPKSPDAKLLVKVDTALIEAGRSLYQPRVDDKGRKLFVKAVHHKYVNWTPGRSHGGLVKLPDATAEQVIALAIKSLKGETQEKPTRADTSAPSKEA